MLAYISALLITLADRHHHVESVHIQTSKGMTLHPEVAVVQTPGRQYYVLRDNGMQIGCDEEGGIADIWQEILHCTALGLEN